MIREIPSNARLFESVCPAIVPPEYEKGPREEAWNFSVQKKEDAFS